VEVIRGIPLLVQIFYIYYALGRIVHIPDIYSAVIAMAVCYGAYMGEIFRAGIQSIPKGQMEAARSLGMTHTQAMSHIIIPQAVKVILPHRQRVHRSAQDSCWCPSWRCRTCCDVGGVRLGDFSYFETYTVVA
jgi:polar amino acid transport system permease protein